MIAVITGDIINSRSIKTPEIYLNKLKSYFQTLGKNPQQWEIFRGDSFQIELDKVEEALNTAIYIKALIKTIKGLDVRLSVGIGKKTYTAKKISESNGEAFIFSGELFDELKKNNLAIRTPWKEFDEYMNLSLELALIPMNSWTQNSAEIVLLHLQFPTKTQKELAEILSIKQGNVSARQKRAAMDEVLKLEKYFRKQILLKL